MLLTLLLGQGSSGSSNGTATGSIAAVTLSAMVAIGSGGATVSKAPSAVTLSAPTGTASGSSAVNGNATGSLSSVTLAAHSGSASGGASASVSPSSVSLSAPLATASGGSSASGSVAAINLVSPTGSASGGSGAVDGNGSGEISAIYLSAINGYAVADKKADEPMGGYPYRLPKKKQKALIEQVDIDDIDESLEEITQEKVKLVTKKANIKKESSEYWDIHVYEYLLNEKLAKIRADYLLQKLRDNAINSALSRLIEDALIQRQMLIEQELVAEYNRITEEDLIFVLSVLSEV